LLNSTGSDQKEEYLRQIVDLLVFDQKIELVAGQ